MRINFDQKVYTVAYNNELPFTSINSAENRGLETQLLKTLSQYFNFTIKYINCNGDYGAPRPNRTWSGIIGKIQEQEMDFGIGGIIMSYKRLSVVEFLYPHWIDQFTFGTVPPRSYFDHFDILIKPIDRNIWIYLFISFFLFPILNQIKHFVQRRTNDENKYLKQKKPEHNLLWINCCLLFRQPYCWLNSLHVSIKIWAIVWIFFSLVMFNVYGGGLYSMLTIRASTAIDTVNKLAQASLSKRIICLGLHNTSIYDSFQESKIDSIKAVSRTMVFVTNLTEGVEMIISQQANDAQHYAIIYPREKLLYSQLIVGSELLYIPPDNGETSFYLMYYGIPVSKSFQYRQQFSFIISRLTSTGMLSKWRNREILNIRFKRYVINHNENYRKFQKFQLEHLKSIFFLYVTLMSLAIITLLLELLIFMGFLRKILSHIQRCYPLKSGH